MATSEPPQKAAGAPRSRRWLWLVAVTAIAAASGGIAYWKWPIVRPLPPKTFTHDDAVIDEPQVQNPGYVGIEACASCHSQRVAEFKTTTHFHACRQPDAENMPPGFENGKGSYFAQKAPVKFESKRSGDRFIQTATQSTPAGEKQSSVNIDLMYGTGNGDQIYFTWKDDRLFELPVAWLFPFHRWAEQPFDPYGSENFLRTTTPRCLECHNTWIGHIPGSENQYQRSNMILGITCEKCHGPGREHVAFHQAHPEAKNGEFVVKPRQLPRDRQMDLCGQCHNNAPKRRGPAFSYRPGEPLEKYFRTAADSNQEDEHVANQVRYLRESKCFQKSDLMTCVTCHNPHRPATSAETAAGQRSCQKCHKESDCHERERLPVAVRNDCVNCHMPKFTRIQVYFHVPEDQYIPPLRPHQHRIAVYPTATQEILLNWRRSQSGDTHRQEAAKLAKALTDHWQAEAERFRNEYRFLAAIGAYREALRIDPSPRIREKLNEVIAIKAKIDGDWFKALHEINQQQFSDAIDTINGILKLNPNLAKAHGRLGTLYANANRADLAVEHFQQAAKLDPDDPQGEMMMAWLAFLAGNFEESAAHYVRADQIDPFNVKINYLWGTALAKLKRWREAAERFRETIKIDPNHEGGCLSLAICLEQQKKPADALRYAQRAARLTQFENADALLALGEIYIVLGRFEEAADIAEKGLALPKSKLEPEMRKRLQEIRARSQRGSNQSNSP